MCAGPVSGLLLVTTDSTSFSQPRLTKARGSDHLYNESKSGIAPIIRRSPVPTALYDDTLLFQFLNYFSQHASERTWSAKLPSLISAKNAAAMKTAARAVSLAFAAENIHDPSMAQAACEYYGSSLRYHQASFRAPPGRSICKKKAINALPVTVLLSYFEMIQATSADAWLKHTLAAERLFVILGPNALHDEFLNHLYFIVRSNSAIRCFLLGTQTSLLERSWSQIPMALPCGRGTAVFNSLIDLTMWLSNGINVDSPFTHVDPMSYDASTLHGTLNELQRLWVVFGENIGLDTGAHPFLVHMFDDTSRLSMDFAEQSTTLVLPPQLQESSAALTCAFFHATAILLLTLLHQNQFSGPLSLIAYNSQHTEFGDLASTKASTLDNAVLRHSSEVLALTGYLRTQRIGCACLRMILPLAIVNRFSPSRWQSDTAETIFRSWSASDGLSGLATFAFGGKETRSTASFRSQDNPGMNARKLAL